MGDLNKADWIALYGSADLQEKWFLIGDKHQFSQQYLSERLKFEYPGFKLLRISSIINPSDISKSISKMSPELYDRITVDFGDMLTLINLCPAREKCITKCDSPSIESIRLAQTYDANVEIRQVAGFEQGKYGQFECLYLSNWLGIFIIYKPIIPSLPPPSNPHKESIISVDLMITIAIVIMGIISILDAIK